jgi:protein ImuA
MQAIERPRLEERRALAETQPAPRAAAWSLGASGLDAVLGPAGLDISACHEIKPGSGKAASRAAALCFALALARRRLEVDAGRGKAAPRILWCSTPGTSRDIGALYPPGLARFGLDAASFLMVEAQRAEDVLWTLEEGLRSGSLLLAVGCLDKIALTPARRLSLAARDGATPALLLTPARSPSSGATATRWRIDPAASAAHPFDARAPGAPRLAVSLERCRSAPPATEAALPLEWSDETHCFRVAATLADRAPEASYARRHTG